MKREDQTPIDGEPPAEDRGIPPVNRVRSMQARVSAALAIGVCALLGGGFLGWYYWGRLPGDAPRAAPPRNRPTGT